MQPSGDRAKEEFAASPIPTIVWRRSTDSFVFEAVNRAASVIAGELADQLVGMSASDMYRDRPDMVEMMERAWKDQIPVQHDLPVRVLVRGREAIFRIDVAPLSPDRLVMHAIDITAQSAAEEGLRVSAHRLKMIFEDSSHAIVRLDDLGKIVEANAAAGRLLGFETKDLIGSPLADLAAPHDPARAGQAFVSEKEFRRPDATSLHVEVSASPATGGGQVLFLRDVTSRRALEVSLRRREEQNRRMIESSPDGICVIAGGIIRYANRSYARLVGATDPAEVIGQPVLRFVDPDDRGAVAERLKELSDGVDTPLPRKLLRLDGTRTFVEVTGMSLEYEGEPAVQVMLRDVSERTRQQEALRRSEERYRGLFEKSLAFIYRIDPGGILIDLNPAGLQATGWAPEEIIGRPFTELIHPEDLSVAIGKFQSAMAGVTRRNEVRILMKSGDYLFLDAVSNPEIAEGQIIGVFGTGLDVTEARVAMKQLEERENLISAVLDRLPIGVVVTDEEGTVVRSNPAGDDIWAFHRTQTALKSPGTYRAWWADTHQPVSTEEWASTLALRSGKTTLNQLLEIEAADGTHKVIMNSAVPLFDEKGKIHGAVVLNQDVTALRMEQAHLEQVAAHLREIIASTSDGICTIDARGRATLVSPAAARMLGSSPDALIGSDLNAVVHGAEASDNSFAEVMRTGQARPLYQDVFTTSERSPFDAEVSCAPIVIAGTVQGAVVTFRDVTRRNVLERELERAQRMSSIGQLAATIAHEFNNVLMGISPFMEVIDRRAQNDEQLRALSSHIQQSLQRGKQITREILKFAQAPDPQVRGLRLRPILESALPELSAIAGRKMTVQLQRGPDDLAACIDPTQVHQALSNLVANARDAMSSEGTISIEASRPGFDEMRHLPPGDWVRIAVRDDGSGIPPPILERIFEPLYTTKQAGGTGLGLAVVQQVVDKHGGFVEVDSVVGRGTTFRLYFPRCEPPQDEKQLPSVHVPRAPCTLVLVEDDRSVAAGLQAVLEMEGITTHVLDRGADAEDAVARFHPDAVVLDRGLPDMDGLDVARNLLRRWPQLPLVFSTGHGGREDIEDLARGGRVAYLLKPYSVSTLLDAINQVLRPGDGGPTD